MPDTSGDGEISSNSLTHPGGKMQFSGIGAEKEKGEVVSCKTCF